MCVLRYGGLPSDEHVVPRWVRKALQISEPVREFSGTTYVGAAETLAIVFHEVCVSCNTGWMESLERAAGPVLGPLLLGAAPGASRVLDPDQQAILATWAVKTSLLLALSKFRGLDYGWVPVSTLQWLYRHHDTRMPPPGTRVWMAGFSTSEVPASVQAACLYDASREPAAQCVTFSVGCVLFQVFATEQGDADLSPDNEAWLAPRGLYTPALLQIAPVLLAASVAARGRVRRRGPGSPRRTAGSGASSSSLRRRTSWRARASARRPARPLACAAGRVPGGVRELFTGKPSVELDDHRRLFWGSP